MDRALQHGWIGIGLCALVSGLPACGPEGPADLPPVSSVARGLVRANGEILIVDGELGFNLDQQGNVIGTGPGERQSLLTQVAAELAANEELVGALDALIVFTTFDDRGNSPDATSLLLFNEISGIGLPTPDSEPDPVEDRREDYGLQPGTPLHSRMRNLVYFNQPLTFLSGSDTYDDLNEVRGEFHALLARRISDRWLFNARFAEGANISDELLGGQQPGAIGSNWSNLADSDGSIQGGYDWVDNGDGSFTNQGTNLGFAPLDLYLMGFIGPQNVSDFFLIRNAVQGGSPVAPDQELDEGDTVSGERFDVSIIDVIEAMGPRSTDGTLYQRVAFALLTLPGQAAEDYREEVEFLQDLQATFPESWKEWTGVTICTRITGTCPEPELRVGAPIITDDNDNLVAPGETVQLDFEVSNTGLGTASGARVRFAVEANPDVSVSPTSVELPDVPQDESVRLPTPVELTVTSTRCGESVEIRTILELAEGPEFSQRSNILIGVEPVRFDPLDEAPDWTVNPDGDDTATSGVWSLGVPDGISAPAGIPTQPGSDATPGADSVLAFMTQPRSDGIFARSDLDGGKTTLQSPVFAIGDTRDPIVRVWLWRSAYDFTERDPVPLDTPLVIEVSNDGGSTWTVVEEFTEQTTEWTPYDIRLRSEEVNIRPTNRMVFRFSIEDDTRNGIGNIEAGVDDLEITDFLDGCPGIIEPEEPTNGGGGGDEDDGGCRAVPVDGVAGIGLLLGALLLVRRRRRGPV